MTVATSTTGPVASDLIIDVRTELCAAGPATLAASRRRLGTCAWQRPNGITAKNSTWVWLLEAVSIMNLSQVLGLLLVSTVLGACGGSDQDSDVGAAASSSLPSPSVSATTKNGGHAAEAGEPQLIQVEGYKYTDPTGPELNACKLFSDEIMKSCSVHGVSGLGTALLVQVQWEVDPQAVPPGTMISGLATIFEQQNATVKKLTIAGEPVIKATMPDGITTIYAWEHEEVLVMFQSDEPKDSVDFVTKYVTLLNG